MKMESSVRSSLPPPRSEGTWEIVSYLLPFIHCKVLTSILLVLPLSYKFLQQETSLCQPSVITEHRIDGWRPENNSSPLWRTKLQSIPLQLMDDRTFSASEKSKKKNGSKDGKALATKRKISLPYNNQTGTSQNYRHGVSYAANWTRLIFHTFAQNNWKCWTEELFGMHRHKQQEGNHNWD